MAIALVDGERNVGESIPAGTAHACSVSLPTWRANIGYEEGQEWVISRMQTGYPRFFVHKSIQALAAAIVAKYGQPNEKALLMPSAKVAHKCYEFYRSQNLATPTDKARILEFVVKQSSPTEQLNHPVGVIMTALIHPQQSFPTAKTFWQHSGDGISSRKAEYCHHLLKQDLLIERTQAEKESIFCKGPKRYRGKSFTTNGTASAEQPELISPAIQPGDINPDDQDHARFIEERFGRNLNLAKAAEAKVAVRRRIAGSLISNVDLDNSLEITEDTRTLRQVEGLSTDDVYLFPSGMSSIFNTHQAMLHARQPRKSIMFGFPYIDTLKILEKFGPGCLFYGQGSAESLDDLERRLEGGEKYLALFCEFPGNPLLTTPDIARIKQLGDKYDFAVVIDETIGNFLNVHVLPYADVIVSSLSKVFSGDANVMGGSAILNPKGRYYHTLKTVWSESYEDNLWAEDALFLERNSRDFASRIARINTNAELICDILRADSRIKAVNYPKFNTSRQHYDNCRTPNGGYGGLLSATFHKTSDAIAFYDALDTAKGPSLGTNFTISSPYVILAHYTELDWAASFGVDADLIRFSVGLEDPDELGAIFKRALAVLPVVG